MSTVNDDLKRLQSLEDNIKEDLDLLKAYEDKLQYTSDPRELANVRRQIDRQKESVFHYQQEYDKLKAQIGQADKDNIICLLKQEEGKLAKLHKMLPEVWNIAQFRNRNFTGREQIMAELSSPLTLSQRDAWKRALCGMSGVGKTQIAVEYAYRHMADYRVVWWVRSEPSTLSSDYALLAAELRLPEKDLKNQIEVVRATRRWFERNSRWLLIFDNAINPEDIEEYLPRTGDGNVIITSKNPNWNGIADAIEIKLFNRIESIQFLQKRTRKEVGADKLAEVLGDLPLALEQAGAYIGEVGISLWDYIERFEKHSIKILERGKSIAYPISVAATFSLSFQAVQEKSETAADLLRLCSFLAPEKIPKSLFVRGSEHLPATLASTMKDELKFDDAIGALRSYSLINVDAEWLSVHKLVQLVIRDRMSEKDREKWAGTAVRLLDGAFPIKSDDVGTWEVCSILLPHVLVSIVYAEELEIAIIGHLLSQACLYLLGRGKFIEAKSTGERALMLNERVYGPNHPIVARDVNNLGMVLQSLGDLQGAKKHYERALEIDLAALDSDYPNIDIARDINDLGSVMKALGDLKGARKYYERALEIDREALGPNSTNVALRINNLGSVIKALGDLKGAKKHYERALEIYENALGPDHPQVALTLNNLGSVLHNLGNVKSARKCYEKALKINEKALGPDHPDVATAANNLGSLMQDLGDLKGAKKQYEKALKINEKALGPDHPQFAIILKNLGSVTKALGDLRGARMYYERALEINLKVSGSHHPNAELRINNLRSIIQTLDDLERNKENFEKALRMVENVSGPNSSLVATLSYNQGMVLQAIGDIQGSRERYEKALKIQRGLLGKDHRETRATKKRLKSLKLPK